MGREQRRTDGESGRLAEPAGDSQHLEFGIQVESVAGLDFDGCHALAGQHVQPGQRIGVQLFLAGRPGRIDGGEDTAAFRRDVYITRTAQTSLVLTGPLAAEDEVRMAVDEGGGHPAP